MRLQFSSWVGKMSWRRAWQPTSVFLPGEFLWTEESGRLQSMKLQRIRCDWAIKNRTFSAVDVRAMDLIPGLEKSTREENDNPLQYSCFKNSMDRGVWQAIVLEVTKSWTQLKRLSTHVYLPATQETWVWSLSQEDPLEEEWQSTPVFWPGKFLGQWSLVGYSPWGHKELDMTE